MEDKIIGKYFTDEVRNKKIKKEIRKLKKIIKNVSDDKKTLCFPLIENISFCIVQLEELRGLVAENGYYEKYTNGKNQEGFKKSIASDMIISVGKNYSMYLGRLKDFVPEGTATGDVLTEFDNETKVKK